jgi:Protein of unknown function (DUF3810)
MTRLRAPADIRVANRATRWPVSPIDVVVAGPLVARLLFGATPIGRAVQAVSLGLYLASAARDWLDRRGIRKIDFAREFGASVRRLNDEFTAPRMPRRELAALVDRHLTDYIAGITGQRVHTSAEVRGFALVGVMFPFALGACDMLTGDVAIFRDTGFLEPHVIAHEFSHRKAYWKELEAQALAYLSLTASGEPALVQSARLERLHRTLLVLAGHDPAGFRRLLAATPLRPELRESLLALSAQTSGLARRVEQGLRGVYDRRMRLTGQNGVSDYSVGFTNLLFTFETSATARQRPPAAGVVHRKP